MAHEVIHVPISSLPSKEDERDELLLDYFRDLLPTANRLDSQWEIVLERPYEMSMYVDPNLHEGLAWWGDVTVPSIFSRYKRRRHCLLSLHDNWTLLSWANWRSRKLREDGKVPSQITILHLDDHTDFMDPLLTAVGCGYEDLLTSRTMQLDDKESVRSSILSGAIGVGSFMAPFLHEFENVTFLHLAHRNSRNPAAYTGTLYATRIADQLLRPGVPRPSLSVFQSSASANAGRTLGRYHKEFELDRLLDNQISGPILLHIDMDYFNNRFNGDSNWKNYAELHDRPLTEIVNLIQDVMSRLSNWSLAGRVEDVSIGLSPGFFPAELWQTSVEQIENCLEVASLRFSLQNGRIEDG